MVPLVPGAIKQASNLQTARPFPQFNNVNSLFNSWGNSSYESLNLKLEKRYSNGLNLMANYTWSKYLDDVKGNDDLNDASSSGYQHIQLHHLDKSLSGSHVPHRFVASGVYELPFGIGRRWSHSSKLLNGVIGGWGMGANLTLQSG